MEPLIQTTSRTPWARRCALNVVGKSRTNWSLLLTTACLVPTSRCLPQDMASFTVDQKLLFERYDGVPGIGCRRLRKNIILHGGPSDENGFNYADVLLREDQGALVRGTGVVVGGVMVAGVPAAGAPAMPGHAAALAKAVKLKTKRVKDSAVFLLMHFSDEQAKDMFTEAPYRNNGPEIFDQIIEDCNVPLKTNEINAQKEKVRSLDITHDVGKTENSVQDLLKLARSENLLLDPPDRISNHELAEMILTAIGNSTSHLHDIANDELNKPAGPIGALASRQFQVPPTAAAIAAAAAAGLPAPLPTRNLTGLVTHFHAKWRSAVIAKIIHKAPAQRRSSASGHSALEVESGRMANALAVLASGTRDQALAAEAMRVEREYGRGIEILDGTETRAPQETLEVLRAAGVDFDHGTVTTTNWDRVLDTGPRATGPPLHEVMRAVDAYFRNQAMPSDYEIIMGMDANQTALIEMLCHGCWGAGHRLKECPSPRRRRTVPYVIGLLQAQQSRADGRAGATPGGRRAPMRGQVGPIMPQQMQGPATPASFSPSARTQTRRMPFRRFTPASRNPGGVAGRSAEESMYQGQECDEDEEETTHYGSRARESQPESGASVSTSPAPPAPAPKAVSSKGQGEPEMPTTASFQGTEAYFARMAERGRGGGAAVEHGRGATVGPAAPPLAKRTDLRLWGARAAVAVALVSALIALFLLLEVETASSVAITATGTSAVLSLRETIRRAAVLARGLLELHWSAWVLVVIALLLGRVTAAPVVGGRLTSRGLPRLALGAMRGHRTLPTGASLVLDTQQLYTPESREFGTVIPCKEAFGDAFAAATEAARHGKVRNGAEKKGVESEGMHLNERGLIVVCDDSGASSLILPMSDLPLADEITSGGPARAETGWVTPAKPNVGVEVADGYRLQAGAIGNINSHTPSVRLVCDSFRPGADGEVATVTAPKLSRAIFTEGLKCDTRLMSVTKARDLDGILSYFNEDNMAGISDCVRFPDGTYLRFMEGGRNELAFRPATDDDRAAICTTESCNYSSPARMHKQRSSQVSEMTLHASCGHVAAERLRGSKLLWRDVDLSSFEIKVSTSDCAGCRIGRCQPVRYRKGSAPSRGRPTSVATVPREPSTVGYAFFGQRMDADMSTCFPKSFPHQLTVFTNFVDRHTNETFLFFQREACGEEVNSALLDLEERCSHRLLDGKIQVWSTDNDMAFEGSKTKEVTKALIEKHERSAGGMTEKNSHPVAERSIGTIRQMMLAMIHYPRQFGYGSAPECLWSWAAAQCEVLLYYLSTESHNPPTSPYRFSFPDEPPTDVGWAQPMFCDVTIRLQEPDISGKLAPRGVDGTHLGYDTRRNCHFCYLPEINRLGSFTVSHWRPESFKECQGIRSDTPVNYREDGNDLRVSPETESRIPKRRRTSAPARAAEETSPETDGEEAVLRENARRITDGVVALEKKGVAGFVTDAHSGTMDSISEVEKCLLTGRENCWSHAAGETVEIELDAPSERARGVAVATGITEIKTIDQAMASQWWPLFKIALESEIKGKVGNGAWKVVPRPTNAPVMKGKWVITVTLTEEGAIKKLKTRYVGCGYSQMEGRDYDTVYAATPPAFALRYWFTCVGDEDLETDHIDAIKAFTQADLDRLLYCEMPDGFVLGGYVLLLLKALEGIKQGAYLWFQKNKWAWGKVGCYAEIEEPNLYSHETLHVLIAVFADDCAAGFDKAIREDYLKMREAYGKLINIDSPGPDITVPVTLLVGIDVVMRDRARRIIRINQKTYVNKIKRKYGNKITMNTMPFPATKAKREAFERMPKGTAETEVRKAEYLEGQGEMGWTTMMTYPECAYTHSKLGSHVMHPTQEAHDALMYHIGYVVNHIDDYIEYGGKLKKPAGLQEMPTYFEESSGLYVSHDSSWGKELLPYAGHVVMKSNGAMYWSAAKLKVLADSTCQAETAEASRALKSLIFARTLARVTRRAVMGASYALGDNSASWTIIQKEGSSQKTRWFERATILVKFAVLRDIMKPMLVKTTLMIADIFTKAVDEETFTFCKRAMRNMAEESVITQRVRRMRSALARATGMA